MAENTLELWKTWTDEERLEHFCEVPTLQHEAFLKKLCGTNLRVSLITRDLSKFFLLDADMQSVVFCHLSQEQQEELLQKGFKLKTKIDPFYLLNKDSQLMFLKHHFTGFLDIDPGVQYDLWSSVSPYFKQMLKSWAGNLPDHLD